MRQPGIVKHGSAAIHDGVEYLVPSGQTECRYILGEPFVAVFEFDTPVFGEQIGPNDFVFLPDDFEISGGYALDSAEEISLSADGKTLRLTLSGLEVDSYCSIRFTARSVLAALQEEDVRRTYRFYWPVLLGDVGDNASSDVLDEAAIRERIGAPLETCSGFRFDLDRDGAITESDNSLVLYAAAEGGADRVDGVSRKFHGMGECFDIMSGAIEPRYEPDGAGTQRMKLVFSFWREDPITLELLNYSPLASDCGQFNAGHFGLSKGVIESVGLSQCQCVPGCDTTDLEVVVSGIDDEDYFTIGFDVVGPGGLVISVMKQWTVYVGAVGYPTNSAEFCDFFSHLEFVYDAQAGYGEPIDETNYVFDLDLNGIIEWWTEDSGDYNTFDENLCRFAGPNSATCTTIPTISGCCLQSGDCIDVYPDGCASLNGYRVEGQLCSDAPCSVMSLGACCHLVGSQTECDFITLDECGELFGNFSEGEPCGQTCVELTSSPSSGILGTPVTLTISPANPPMVFDDATTATWTGVYQPLVGASTEEFTVTFTAAELREISPSEAIILLGDGSISPCPDVASNVGGTFVGTLRIDFGSAVLHSPLTFSPGMTGSFFTLEYQEDESGLLSVVPELGVEAAPPLIVEVSETDGTGLFLETPNSFQYVYVLKIDDNADTLAGAPESIQVSLLSLDENGVEVDRIDGLTLGLISPDGDPEHLIYSSSREAPIVLVNSNIGTGLYPSIRILVVQVGGNVLLVPCE